jgi:UDP:flavonoid glycosyltransferase YjiC (YdhE family)
MSAATPISMPELEVVTVIASFNAAGSPVFQRLAESQPQWRSIRQRLESSRFAQQVRQTYVQPTPEVIVDRAVGAPSVQSRPSHLKYCPAVPLLEQVRGLNARIRAL